MARDTIENWTVRVDGETFRVALTADDYADPPWDNSDCHGPVRALRRMDDKNPGERPLTDLRDSRGTPYVYDWQAAMKQALRDGWGAPDGRRPGETAGAYAARAVEADFQYLRRWCCNDWTYICIEVTDRHGESTFLGCVDYEGDGRNDAHIGECVANMARDLRHDRITAWRTALARARTQRARIAAAWAGWMEVPA